MLADISEDQMLIDFSVTNFRSIKEKQTLSLLATKDNKLSENVFQSPRELKIKLLKSGIIYGPNASGKSNLLKALRVFIDLIEKSSDNKEGQIISHYNPFRLDISYLKKPTIFEIEFIGSDYIRYKYLVSYNEEKIIEEKLTYFPKNQEVKLFIRFEGKAIEFGDRLLGNKKSIEEFLLKNNLFLSKAANSKNDQLKALYLYFRDNYIFLIDSFQIGSNNIMKQIFTTSKIYSDINYMKLIAKFMKLSDTGIDSIGLKKKKSDSNISKTETSPFSIINEFKNSLSFEPVMQHKINNETIVDFILDDESQGTIKLYELSGDIINILKNGGILIIDELNNGLHPYISYSLIKLFHDPETNPKNAQLILSTHDTSLLSSELFRRDQIWFTEKKNSGTTIYSMSEFDYKDVRSNIPFEKWYLTGRFGALPFVELKKIFQKNQGEEDAV